MPDESFRFTSDADGMPIQAYAWCCSAEPRGVVVIAHGAAEHALRYERFARALNDASFDVWAADHRGHGQTSGLDGRGDFGEGGWDALVADIGQLIGIARASRPRLPLALFSHSMGSAAAQQFAPDGSHSIDALVLSGSAARVRPREGEVPPAFEPNRAFEPARTPFDWLSRDEAEVDKYVVDPFCGFPLRPPRRARIVDPALYGDLDRLRQIRPDLPCLLLAGDKDPVNRGLEGLHELERWWRAAGLQRIDALYYEGGRHEMLNETNRDDVTRDVIAWLRDALRIESADRLADQTAV
ncbi:MAG: alpha/beta fold hydrolase [Dehalococcoidia bacterium]